MKHPNLSKTKRRDRPAYEAGPNGFLARAAAAGFEDDINALVTNYVLDDEARAQLRLMMDQHGMSGGAFATGIDPLRLTGKLAPGFYTACLILHSRIADALEAG